MRAMPASAHFASPSPPPALAGVPETPTAPITLLPERIGTPPAAVVMLGRSSVDLICHRKKWISLNT